MQEKIAEPTIGRIVYIYHVNALPGGKWEAWATAGIVAHVDGMSINVAHIDRDGTTGPLTGIKHQSEAREGDPLYWDWMPFQKGQAAKTEQLQAELDRKTEEKRDQSLDGKFDSR